VKAVLSLPSFIFRTSSIMKSEKSHGENAAAQVHGHADGDFGLDGGVDQAKIGTSYDEQDMWRIGRRQELNVKSFQRIYTRLTSAYNFEAKLPIHIHLGIHLCADEHLGGRPDVSKPRICSERVLRIRAEVPLMGSSMAVPQE
jgi:hypothetical protein